MININRSLVVLVIAVVVVFKARIIDQHDLFSVADTLKLKNDKRIKALKALLYISHFFIYSMFSFVFAYQTFAFHVRSLYLRFCMNSIVFRINIICIILLTRVLSLI